MITKSLKLTFLVLALCVAIARGGTNGFLVPPFRGSANSQAGYWEIFTVPVGAPGNTADKAGATTSAVLTQSDTNAFLTGSGNIYNLNGLSAFTISNTTPFTLGTVVLQTRTIGGELDYNAVALNYVDGSGSHSLAPLPRVELNRASQPGLGSSVSSLWQWNLSGLNMTSYVISFHTVAASCSFDSLTLDTSSQFAPIFTAPFQITNTAPSIERWMYANNAAPCDRTAGASFGTFGDEANVDTRHAQHLVGWDTASLIPTNAGASRYLVNRVRLTLTINRGNLFAYDPTHDDFRTYFESNHVNFIPDEDAGRPIELFGVGFRNGFNITNFDQCAPFGVNTPTNRNAYAVGYSTNGVLVDVSNNVGKTNANFPRFEVRPFAIGQTASVAPGQLVPAGAKITFDLNLADPFVLAYVQSALNGGRLRLMVSSLHTTGGQFRAPSYPDFATHFNDAVLDPTRIEIEGQVVSSIDRDADGLPDDWEVACLHSLAFGATDDPDGDGASNLAEVRAGTDPLANNSALRLTTTVGANGAKTLRFPHAANCRYAIEFTDALGSWQRLTNAPFLFTQPSTAQWTDNGSLTGGVSAHRFYRIAVEP